MKRVILQGMLALAFLVGTMTIGIPGHIAHAASMKPTKPNANYSIAGPAGVTCLGVSWYAYVGLQNELEITQFNVTVPQFASFADTSPATPAVACFHNRIYFAWLANDPSDSIWVGWWTPSICSGNCTLQGRTTIPGQSTIYAPALGVNNGGLYAIWRGRNNTHLYTEISVNGTYWYGQTPMADTAVAGPAAISYQGLLWIAWPGTDSGNHIWFGSYNGSSTLDNHHYIPNQADFLQVGLSVYNNRLQFAWRGFTNYNIYTESYEPPSSFVPNGALSGASSYFNPGLDGKYCYFTGTDQTVYEHDVYPY